MSHERPDSLDTLLRIAERNPVTPEKRKKKIKNSARLGIGFGIVGIALGGGSVVSMVQEGAGPWNIAGVAAGGASIIGGVVGCIQAYRVNQSYEQQLRSGEPFSDSFYLLEGQVSTQETPVEQAYGQRIIPVSSLDTLRQAPSDYASGDLCFIDDVTVAGKPGEPTIIENEARFCDDEYTTTTFHRGELDFERGGSQVKIHYLGHKPFGETFSGILKHQGERLALLFQPQSTGIVGTPQQFCISGLYLMNNLT